MTTTQDTQLPQLTASPRYAPEKAVQGLAPEVKSARAGKASVEAQLVLLQTAMKEERALRLSQATQANIELAEMRRALQYATVDQPSESPPERRFQANVVVPLMITAVLVVAVGMLAFHPEWVSALQHPWVPDASAVHQPAKGSQKARVSAASPESLPEPAAEQYELARLNGALDAIPATALPTIMGSVNQWLWSLGSPPCSMESAQGDVSLVITGQGQDRPLLTALSRCADAVEHFTSDESVKPK